MINGVSAVEIEPSDPIVEDCPELPAKFEPLFISNGIWIGSSDQSIRQNLGDCKVVKSVLTYIYFGRQGEFDVAGAIAIRMKNGKAKAINITHNTTN